MSVLRPTQQLLGDLQTAIEHGRNAPIPRGPGRVHHFRAAAGAALKKHAVRVKAAKRAYLGSMFRAYAGLTGWTAKKLTPPLRSNKKWFSPRARLMNSLEHLLPSVLQNPDLFPSFLVGVGFLSVDPRFRGDAAGMLCVGTIESFPLEDKYRQMALEKLIEIVGNIPDEAVRIQTIDDALRYAANTMAAFYTRHPTIDLDRSNDSVNSRLEAYLRREFESAIEAIPTATGRAAALTDTVNGILSVSYISGDRRPRHYSTEAYDFLRARTLFENIEGVPEGDRLRLLSAAKFHLAGDPVLAETVGKEIARLTPAKPAPSLSEISRRIEQMRNIVKRGREVLDSPGAYKAEEGRSLLHDLKRVENHVERLDCIFRIFMAEGGKGLRGNPVAAAELVTLKKELVDVAAQSIHLLRDARPEYARALLNVTRGEYIAAEEQRRLEAVIENSRRDLGKPLYEIARLMMP